MPHVVVKMLAGRSDEQKAEVAQAVASVIVATAGCGEEAVSVAIEDVERSDWTQRVYRPDIAARPDNIFKKPGYGPFQSLPRRNP